MSIEFVNGFLNVLSRFYNAIDSGDSKPGRLKLSGGGVPPEGDGKPPQEPQGVA